jgi:putative ABC transport system substrate-binding protein
LTRGEATSCALSSNRLPGIFHIREYPADGGLMSYGASLSDTYRQLGVYAGKVLRAPSRTTSRCCVTTKFELVINTKTAKC